MKKKILLMGVASLLLLCSCNKTKSCRCSVLHQQKVRIIDVKPWADCADIRYVEFNASAAETGIVDSVLCTDIQFEIDSLFNK